MKTPLNNPPPADAVGQLLKAAPRLEHPNRAEWNRRLDRALATNAVHVAAMAQQSGNEARSRGDVKATAVAGEIERRARKVAQAGRGWGHVRRPPHP